MENLEKFPEEITEKDETNRETLQNKETLTSRELLNSEEETEKGAESSSEKASTEEIREQAIEIAEKTESDNKSNRGEVEPRRFARGPISKKKRQENYKRTLSNVQSELPKNSRRFSKVIHNPLVEKTSDVLASTVMRPRPLLIASILGFILPLIAYLIAREMGYQLSGSESILAMFIGLTIGLLVDYLRLLIGKK